VFENKMLRGIFGPKKEKLTGGWIKLCIEESRYLEYLKKSEVGRACSTHGREMLKSYGHKI